jgi:hypothetical protein
MPDQPKLDAAGWRHAHHTMRDRGSPRHFGAGMPSALPLSLEREFRRGLEQLHDQLVVREHRPGRQGPTISGERSDMSFETRQIPVAIRASQPWINAVEAAVDWYGAMLRLAFGLGRVSGSPARSSLAASSSAAVAAAAPSTPQPESSTPQPESSTPQPESPPMFIVPAQAGTTVPLRRKRKVSKSGHNARSRSRKTSRRSRRAA